MRVNKRIRIYLIIILFNFVLLSTFSLQTSSIKSLANNNNQIHISQFQQNLSILKPGDIAFKFPDIFPNYFPKIIDHCLIFVEFDESTGMYVFIEANVPNKIVQFVYEKESNLTKLPFGPVARVKKANDNQIINAIDFAKKQVGKSFQMIVINKNYNPEDNDNDPYANQWYCSELIWAAYYNCNNSFPELEPQSGYVYGEGIDIDRRGENKYPLNFSIVFPRDILFNRREVSIFHLY